MLLVSYFSITSGGTTRILLNDSVTLRQEPVTVLGIWISKSRHEIQTLNLEQRVDKLNTILNVWKQRGLTIKSKIAIVKAKALPLITYVTNFIYVPKDVIEAIDKLLYEFVWKKKHHVKRPTLNEKNS